MMWVWLVIFIVLAAIEGLTYDLVSIWFCIGAIAGMIAAALGASFWTQVICCVVVGTITLIALRPYMQKRIMPTSTKTNLDRLEGMTAIVLEEVNHFAGAVKADGKEWNARSSDANVISAGTPCKIIKLDGNKLIVTAENIYDEGGKQ